jgi:hypothetical protein
MGTAAIVCNIVLIAITGVIILTEGVPRDARYLVLTLLMLLVPLLSAVVLVRARIAPQGPSTDDDRSLAITLTNRAAVLCNLVLFGASCWAVVAQYPYPEGNSVIPFAVLTVCTPILSLMALLGGGRRAMREERQSTAGGE